MKPGIYNNLPIQLYHAEQGYSSSQLRLLLNDSTLAFKHEYLLKDRPDLTKWGQTNRAMCVGGAVAAMMDGPDTFVANYFVIEPKVSKLNKNTKEFKEAFSGATIRHGNKTVLLEQERLQAFNIFSSIYAHPDNNTREQLKSLFYDANLQPEVSYFHEDTETGLLVKTRPDLSLPGLLADIKTITTSCASRDVSKRILAGGYHIQAAMGLDIVNAVRGTDITNWLLIVVEQSPPHDVGVYYLDEPTLELGHKEYRRGLATLAECLESGIWPGKVAGIQPIGVPEYALREEL